MARSLPSHNLHLNCTRVTNYKGVTQGRNCVSLAPVQPKFTKCYSPTHRRMGKCLRIVSMAEVTNPSAFPRYRRHK